MTKHSSVDDQGLDNKVQNEGSKPDVMNKKPGEKSQEELTMEKFKENDKNKGGNKSDTIT